MTEADDSATLTSKPIPIHTRLEQSFYYSALLGVLRLLTRKRAETDLIDTAKSDEEVTAEKDDHIGQWSGSVKLPDVLARAVWAYVGHLYAMFPCNTLAYLRRHAFHDPIFRSAIQVTP